MLTISNLQEFLNSNPFVEKLITGIVTIVLSVVTGLYLGRRSYKTDYMKKVLEKRFEAYEKLELLLKSLSFIQSGRTSGEHFIIYSAEKEVETWDNLYSSMMEALSYQKWYDSETSDLLNQLLYLIGDVYSDTSISGSDTPISNLNRNVVFVNRIGILKEKILKQSLQDFKNLHKIDSFLAYARKQ